MTTRESKVKTREELMEYCEQAMKKHSYSLILHIFVVRTVAMLSSRLGLIAAAKLPRLEKCSHIRQCYIDAMWSLECMVEDFKSGVTLPDISDILGGFETKKQEGSK